MGFGAILGQKPGSVGIGAVVQRYKVADGVTISPGDLVGLIDEIGPVQVPLSSYSPWTTLQFNENGTPTNYWVAQHNYYSEQNTNRTLLIRTSASSRTSSFNSSIITTYANSELDNFYNTTYYNLFDENIKQAMQSTTILVNNSNYSGTTTSNIQRNVFCLSSSEILGVPGSSFRYPILGTQVPGFSSRIGSYDFWVRQVEYNSAALTVGYFYIDANLGVSKNDLPSTSSLRVRPAFTLPSDFLYDTTAPTGNKVLTNADSQTMGIALESGTGGDYIDVILSGTIEIDWGTPGQEITSSGVSGFIPAQGILWVSPYWDSDTITGGYMGTGTYGVNNANHLAFESTPKEITIVSDDNTMATLDMKTNTAILYSDNKVSVNSITVEPTETGINWYGNDESSQLNKSGVNYNYTAKL